jgi:hypothetical protein
LVQDNKSFEDVRHELEGSNPVLELDPHLIDGAKNFNDFSKYPLEKLQASADDLPEDVDKTRREVRTTIIYFVLFFFALNSVCYKLNTNYCLINCHHITIKYWLGIC